MRTTITLEPDVETLLKRQMRDRGVSFKAAVNEAIRAGLAPAPQAPFRGQTFSIGFDPAVDLDKALRLVGEMEDAEVLRRVRARK